MISKILQIVGIQPRIFSQSLEQFFLKVDRSEQFWKQNTKFFRSWDANFPEQLNADFTIKHLMKLGAPAKKLVLGIPTYGRGFSVQANSNMKPPLPANGGSTAGPITREAGYLG